MKVAVIVAMSKELQLLLPLIEDASAVSINNFTYHTGRLGRHEVVAVQCGIGKVNAAVSTLTMIEHFHPSLVINTGVAGGTGHSTRILDVVIGSKIAYHDCWCGPGTDWGQAAGYPQFFESVPEIASLPVLTSNPRVRHGLIASGDIFVSRGEDVKRIMALYPDAIAVDMESAAIAQVCSLKNVPFFVMRVVSDTPGADDNISQYENFWDDAPRSTFDLLTDILNVI